MTAGSRTAGSLTAGSRTAGIRVFVVDDHPTFRVGLRVALEESDAITVAGEASNGEEAVRVLPTLDPGADVVLMDIRLAGCSGVEATRLVSGLPAAPRVLVMSAAEEDDAIIGALRAGAKGFIDKGVSREDLLHSIRLVASGGAVFSPWPAGRLSDYFAAIHRQPGRLAFPELTERETQILDLLARGQDNRSIARELMLAEKTIRNNITSVFTKLNVTGRTAAAVRARDAGLGVDSIDAPVAQGTTPR
jgi:DNA-binding NarL/FixJ family response regulator